MHSTTVHLAILKVGFWHSDSHYEFKTGEFAPSGCELPGFEHGKSPPMADFFHAQNQNDWALDKFFCYAAETAL